MVILTAFLRTSGHSSGAGLVVLHRTQVGVWLLARSFLLRLEIDNTEVLKH